MVYQKSPVLVCTILREGYKLAKGYPIFPDTLVPVKAQYFLRKLPSHIKILNLNLLNYDLVIMI